METESPSIECHKNQLQKNPTQESEYYLNQGNTFRSHQNHYADVVDHLISHSSSFLQVHEGRSPSGNESLPAARQSKLQMPQYAVTFSPRKRIPHRK